MGNQSNNNISGIRSFWPSKSEVKPYHHNMKQMMITFFVFFIMGYSGARYLLIDVGGGGNDKTLTGFTGDMRTFCDPSSCRPPECSCKPCPSYCLYDSDCCGPRCSWRFRFYGVCD